MEAKYSVSSPLACGGMKGGCNDYLITPPLTPPRKRGGKDNRTANYILLQLIVNFSEISTARNAIPRFYEPMAILSAPIHSLKRPMVSRDNWILYLPILSRLDLPDGRAISK